MSDTFDHELEAFERWDNGERDEPDQKLDNEDEHEEMSND
jgi:hypothetical protein